jgi:uncharacterized protein with ATP-grasp and redox domains
MKTYLECIPCIVSQTVKIAGEATSDRNKREELLKTVLETLSGLSYSHSPPYLGQTVHRAIRRVLDNPDPFFKLKREFNQAAKKLYPALSEKVNACPDRFACAVRLAIAGNIIDFGPQHHFELMKTIDEALHKRPAIDHTERLKRELEKASVVLYLGDNAGETFFDRLLIEQMPPAEIYYAVRDSAVINDATSEDAYYAGLDGVAKIISNGSDAPGTILQDCSDDFRKVFDRADVVIAKGHGNYETLNEVEDKKLFFLLMVKCGIVARDLECAVGDFVIKGLVNAGSAPADRNARELREGEGETDPIAFR